jgi:hypothetical protein
MVHDDTTYRRSPTTWLFNVYFMFVSVEWQLTIVGNMNLVAASLLVDFAVNDLIKHEPSPTKLRL